MMHSFQAALYKAKSFINYFDELCKPKPEHIQDKIQQEVIHQRNRVFALFELFVTIVFILSIFAGNKSLSFNLQGLIATVIVIFAIFTLGRRHPKIFRTAYNIYNMVYIFLLIFHGDQEVHGGWTASQVFPGIVYLFTGSIWHFIFNMIVQIIFVNTIFQEPMKRTVIHMTPDAFVQSLTEHLHQTIIYVILFTALTHYMLQNAYQQASVADKKKEDFERQKNFLLGFSHELRNLINSLMGNVKLAGLESLNDKVKDLLLNAEVCAELLLHLVNNILDTGKVEIGELEINPMPVRIYDTMERIWSVCSELIRRKNLRGCMRIQKDIPQILTLDHYRLTQIFLNLVGNAVKFTDNGKIDINVEWIENTETVTDKCFEPLPFNRENDQDEGLFEKRQALSIFNKNVMCLGFTQKKINKALLCQQTSTAKGILKITVVDTGVGIQKESLERLFQRFTQVTTDASRRKLGTGLGLFITKELCQRMNGDVRVFSQPDKGSAFSLCLPIQPANDEVTGASAYIERGKNIKELKALIVDDEHLSRDVLSKFFCKLKIEVTETAENGLSAYHKFLAHVIRKDYFDVITMDLDMPIMDGKMASRKIRETEIENQMTPCFLIVISGNCSESEIKECTDRNGEIRANVFLKKPVSITDLQRIISTRQNEN